MAYYLRAIAHSGLAHYDEALADLNQMIELQPDFTQSYLWRGRVYEEIGEIGLAIADYLYFLEIEVDFYLRLIVEDRLAALGVDPYATEPAPTSTP